MSTATGFHRDDTRGQLAEKLWHLRPPQLLAQNGLTGAISSMHLKHILYQIEPDRDNLRHDCSPLWILTDPLWHTDAVGGRLHHQCTGHSRMKDQWQVTSLAVYLATELCMRPSKSTPICLNRCSMSMGTQFSRIRPSWWR